MLCLPVIKNVFVQLRLTLLHNYSLALKNTKHRSNLIENITKDMKKREKRKMVSNNERKKKEGKIKEKRKGKKEG